MPRKTLKQRRDWDIDPDNYEENKPHGWPWNHLKRQELRCARRAETRFNSFVANHLLYYDLAGLKTAEFINRLFIRK